MFCFSRLSYILLIPVFGFVFGLRADLAAESNGAEYFEKHVRPLLAKHCYACHSGSSQPAPGGLRLDNEVDLHRGGSRGPAVLPGEPQRSLLISAIGYQDESLRMPPAGRLSDDEIAALTSWVKMGAPWGAQPPAGAGKLVPTRTGFWAFQPPAETAVPRVQQSSWPKSPIDRFILAALEAKGLKPAPPANKRTLIRRATFDLTGLPPTPEEAQAFLADASPEAYPRLIDRLLASPRYGEKWGRHWLDVARYADSNGLDENLVYNSAFRYRDYVIDAFNSDMPYDRFIHEQLAGDLLTDGRDEATLYARQTATGFLALGAKMLAEDDPVKMQMDIIDEQLDTMGRAFLALTLGCARCHDHKFDPIPTSDYYSLAGIFKSSKTMENFKVVAKWHEFVLAPKADRDRLEAHNHQIEAKQKQISQLSEPANRQIADQAREQIGAYLLASSDVLRYEVMALPSILGDLETADKPGILTIPAVRFSRGNIDREFKRDADDPNRLVDSKVTPHFAEYEVVLPAGGSYQLEVRRASPQFPTVDVTINGVPAQAGTPPETNRTSSPDAKLWKAIGIFAFRQGLNTIRLEVDGPFPYFDALLVAPSPLATEAVLPKTAAQLAVEYGLNADILSQWADYLRRSKGAPNSAFYAWHAFGTPAYASLDQWTSPVARLFGSTRPSARRALADFYQSLFNRAESAWQAIAPASTRGQETAASAEKPRNAKAERTLDDPALEALRQVLYEEFGPFRVPPKPHRYYSSETRREFERLSNELKTLEASTPQFPHAMGVTEGQVNDLEIHIRGSHLNLGRRMPRRFLTAIAGEDQPPLAAKQSGRLELARWLTQSDHPLTSRVMVNRIWRWHFGKGLVPSTDNFGKLGEPPVNLPLLDWLAREFVRRHWSIKAMHRLIMLSSTYQMSAVSNTKSAEVDPENKLLWRANRRRLDAEEIRDAVIAVGEGLDFAMGGSMLAFKDREYVTGTKNLDSTNYNANRRSVYLPIIRSSLYEVFQAFDYGDPSVSNGDRQSTVVAPQALFMMNSALVLRQTQKMAERLLARAELDDRGRLERAYWLAFGRRPAEREVNRALAFLGRLKASMGNDAPADGELQRLRAWQGLCHALVASNEFVYMD